MSFCSFSNNAAMYDATPIENIFLLEYLPSAPDEFLRVYLYARMLCLHPELGGDFADTAKALGMDEDTVFNAFAYWEQQGLVERLTDRPPTYAMLPVKYDTVCSPNGMERDYYEYRGFNSALQDFFGGKYLLSSKQYKMANDWLNVFGFTQDAVLRLLQYEMKLPGGKTPASVFKRAHEQAVKWADQGIRSAEDVENAIAGEDRVFALSEKIMGQIVSGGRKANASELKLVRKWIEWGLTDDAILEGCEKMASANSPSFAYLNGILENERLKKTGSYDDVKKLLRELGAGHSMPTPQQISSYEKYLESGFDAETISLAAIQCAKKSKNNFGELENLLDRWKEKGLLTHAQVKKHLADAEKLGEKVNLLLETAGSAETATGNDVNAYVRWKEKYSDALIEYAAQCAHGTREPMRYIARLLSQWEKDGVTSPEQAAERRPRGEQPRQSGYQQHDYTEDDYKGFFNDPLKDFGEGSNDQ